MLVRVACLALVGALAFVGAPARADEATRLAARESIAGCVQTADEKLSGADELEAVCPTLRAALTQLGVTDFLPELWEESLDTNTLRQVLALHDRYAGTSTGRAPGAAQLQKALAEFAETQAVQPPSAWERFKAWLRELLSGEDKETQSWLAGLVERMTLPDVVVQIILYVLVGLVIAMAIGIIVTELRAAGVFGKRGASERAVGDDADLRLGAAISMADVEAAPLLDRPALMLRLIVSMLLDLRQLSAERGLTHRELALRARFAEAPDRRRFERLTKLAEKIRFGKVIDGEATLAAETPSVLTDAHALYGDLQRSSNPQR